MKRSKLQFGQRCDSGVSGVLEVCDLRIVGPEDFWFVWVGGLESVS